MATLRQFRRVRNALLRLRRRYLVHRFGIAIHPTSQVSLSAKLRPAGRGSIAIGAQSLVAFRTLILASKGRPTQIGSNCFIGGGAMILPGVTVGKGAIVAAGAVVFDDVPAHCLVAGNPAKIVRENLRTGAYGRLPEADANG